MMMWSWTETPSVLAMAGDRTCPSYRFADRTEGPPPKDGLIWILAPLPSVPSLIGLDYANLTTIAGSPNVPARRVAAGLTAFSAPSFSKAFKMPL
jgi:hypothetical protein